MLVPMDPQAAERRRRMNQELWELAQAAGRYLRQHASPAVRLATALLLAASLAACSASASDTTMVRSAEVAPLTHEVVSGLPRGPGSYEVVPGSVFRDQRGLYQFEWLDPGQTGGPGHVAHVSRLRLVRGQQPALEMVEGDDPILHVPPDQDIGLIQEAQVASAQPGPTFYPPTFSYWSPFTTGLLLGGSRPGYYDPPRTIVVQPPPSEDARSTGSGGGGSAGGGARSALRVEGGSVSETPRPPAQRVTGITSAVSGRAGGTGAGSAVTSKNLSGGASSSVSSAARSGSGVSAPRSGGFSAGSGSSGGSAAS